MSLLDEALFGAPASTVQRRTTRLDVEGDLEGPLYAYTEFDGRDLTITATDGLQAWRGCLTHAKFTQLAKEVKTDLDKFTKLTLMALTRENMDSTNFVYSVSTTAKSELKLSWKKLLREEGIRFELGSIVLPLVSNVKEVHTNILDHMIGAVGKLNSDIGQLQSAKSRLEQDYSTALGRLEACADLKESLEKELYGRFRLILNDKKAKIRRLLEQLSQLSEENHQLKSCGCHDSTPPVVEEDNPGDQSTNETDDELPLSPKKMDLLAEEKKVTTGPVKRRKREGRAVAGPLEIPRPPSLKRPDVRIKKRASNDDSLESDKLLELL